MYLPHCVTGIANTSYGVSSQRRFFTRYCTVDKSSVIFLQSGSEIMQKNLCVGESLLINMWCCVAIEDTCVLHLTQNHNLYFGGYFAKEGVMIKVEGPGRVYFSANKGSAAANGLPTSSGFGQRGPTTTFAIALNVIAMLMTLYLIMMLTTNLFIDNELLDELEKQLDQQIQAARDRANGDL